MSIFESVLPNSEHLVAIVQDGTLINKIEDQLRKPQLFRAEISDVEPWPETGSSPVATGVSLTFTRDGDLPVNTAEIAPGEEPPASSSIPEQWETTLGKWADSVTVDQISDSIGLANQVARKMQQLGWQAGTVMDRVTRNVLFRAYGTGRTVSNTNNAATTTVEVPSVAGFTHQLSSTGQLLPVSANNPKRVSIAGTLVAANLIAATPNEATVPYGPGVLTFDANVNVASNDPIKATDAPAMIYSGGGSSVDALASGDVLQLEDVQRAAATLSDTGVPRHMDGYYHCHITDTMSMYFTRQMTDKNLLDGLGRDAWATSTIAIIANVRFISNSEVPRRSNVGALVAGRATAAAAARVATELGLEMVNDAGVDVIYTIVTGANAITERPKNLMYDLTGDAGMGALGYDGATGNFRPSPGGNGVVANTGGIKFLIGRPGGKLGERFPMSWVVMTGFGVPSDARQGYYGSRLKRCIVIASADSSFSSIDVPVAVT